MGRQVLLEDVADPLEVFWVSDIDLEDNFFIPLFATDSVDLLCMCDQCIQVMEYFEGLRMWLTDVSTGMTDHARRAGNKQMGSRGGWPQGGSRK